MRHGSRFLDTGIIALLAAIVLGLGIVLHPLAVDDAFVTYRYAGNLAAGKGFVYNPGQPVLSTTAPLYALILAAGSLISPDIPALANVLSAVGIGIAAVLLFLMGRRQGSPAAGALAALFLAASPLGWLSLGLETSVFLALALGALFAYRRGRLYSTAVLLALATLTRGDGVILTGVVAADCALRWLVSRVSRKPSGVPRSLLSLAGAAGIYLLVMLPLLAWLAWRFGSPLPATLSAKRAQAELGITGFYAHTTYLQGLWILVRARLAQSSLYLLVIPAVLAGLLGLKRAPWVGLVVAWGGAHLIGYTLLGVTPYYWYYAPLVPALACLSALGIVESGRWATHAVHGIRWPLARPGTRGHLVLRILAPGVAGLWACALLAILFASDGAMVRALDGPVPPPENPVSKVLPEAKVSVYRQAGEWLRDHTPDDSVVGVTEVGVMGYYSERPVVDFLGLLEPDVAQALGRGDLYWALLNYQPDYLALTAVSPLYAYNLRADPWFQSAYAPIETFEDGRFWGSPLTIYKRQVPRMNLGSADTAGLPEGLVRLDVDLGGQIRLLGVIAGQGEVPPGGILPLTLYWQALGAIPQDYTVFVHLLGQYDRVIAQRDASPGLGARPTSRWIQGQIVADPYLIALPEAAYAPDEAVWEVGVYDAQTGRRLQTADGRDNVRFGSVSVSPPPAPLHLDFGVITLTGYEIDRLSLTPGESLHVTLRWAGSDLVGVRLELWTEARELVGVAERNAGGGEEQWTLTLGAGIPPDAYDLQVSVYDPVTGNGLPLLGADGQPQADRARLTKVRVYP